jgi:hypothetical protein
MKSEIEIIGSLTLEIIQSGCSERLSKKILLEALSRKYIECYESGRPVEESLVYEAALKLLIDSSRYRESVLK